MNASPMREHTERVTGHGDPSPHANAERSEVFV